MASFQPPSVAGSDGRGEQWRLLDARAMSDGDMISSIGIYNA